jgi:hypothetical protein
MTSCGYTPTQIDELTLDDVLSLFTYWREFPPAHEILKSVFRIEQKRDRTTAKSEGDPSGIGGLIARFPDGLVRLNEKR